MTPPTSSKSKKAARPTADGEAAAQQDGPSAEAVAATTTTKPLEGRVALVTGASRGIGAATAKALGAEGASVAVNYVRSKGPAEDVAAEIERLGGTAAVFQADISDEGQCTTLVNDTIAAFGKIDVLVNNAGITEDGWFRKMDRLAFDRVIDTNLGAVFTMIKAVIPTMESHGWGRIVNMSSFVGQIGNLTQANYAAAKAGMLGLTKVVALEYATKGITVNAVAPGFIETDMVTIIAPKIQEMLLAKIPMGRWGQPAEVAKAVVFLVRDGSYITGACINVNGGVVTAY
jgi:NAD(P)-dependent dehydrogenase (short-subunit alcohol dehydrogenase family)